MSDIKSLNQAISEIASELNCAPDNEAILEAIDNLKQDYLRRHNDAIHRTMEVLKLRKTISEQSAEIARLTSCLINIKEIYECRFDIFVSEEDLLESLYDRACAALETKG